MAGITVPNPYGQNVAIGPTNGLGGLHEAPETKYGLDKVVGGAAKEVAGAVSRWQDEIDRTNAKDAINKTQQQLRDLETNQENGWANILGENALKRPDGKSLVDEYQLKAKEVIDTQLSELKTSAARKYFERYAETDFLRQKPEFDLVTWHECAQDLPFWRLNIKTWPTKQDCP